MSDEKRERTAEQEDLIEDLQPKAGDAVRDADVKGGMTKSELIGQTAIPDLSRPVAVRSG